MTVEMGGASIFFPALCASTHVSILILSQLRQPPGPALTLSE
jgi:hypothetical protein